MRKERIDKKITLRELSKQTGISISKLSDIEQHRVEPSGGEVDQIALVLGNKLKFAGMEEAKTNQSKLEDYISKLGVIFNKVKEKGFGKNNGGRFYMTCPVCEDSLQVDVNDYNGHVWAVCKKDNCVKFMQ